MPYFFGKNAIICAYTIFLFIFIFVKKGIICTKTIFVVLYDFFNFWKKSIICAEDLILREKNFLGKKCYYM